ncbi:hypothetical protein [Nannocystis sp.]|uniref:hypothetical protein n=1 Tax=Nannocystis sp. TaxID=1962667 RepID=UPI0025DC30E7|nr:hypothetical protein [Nannocystis sp.]MBK7826860.1 hypothetical protein [Nannocystis sp.]
MAPSSGERRSGQRRQLPRSRWQQWPSLLASAVLGVVVAVLLQSIAADAPPQAWAAGLVARVPQPSVGPQQLPRFTAAEAAALRDEAEALTPAAVVLDERAGLRWRPLLGELTAAAVDPATPESVRSDLHATCVALERLGL